MRSAVHQGGSRWRFACLVAVVTQLAHPAFAQTLAVAPEFNPPTLVQSPVSSSGWEDSAQISPDGNRLYFSYARLDPVLHRHTGIVRLGPIRPSWPDREPFATLGAELYSSVRVDGEWQEPQNAGSELNLPEDAEADVWISEDDQRILFTNGDGSPERIGGIYYAWRVNGVWTTPVLAADVGFPFIPGDENPHLTRDELTLFFESERPGGRGGKDIWMSRKVKGKWQPPVNLGQNVNSRGTEGSPFSLDGSVLYFDDKGSGIGIFRSFRQDDGSYGPRDLVVAGSVGDPSLSLAGDLYYTEGTTVFDSQGNFIGFDSNIVVATKRLQ
jgi:hypothetical protein